MLRRLFVASALAAVVVALPASAHAASPGVNVAGQIGDGSVVRAALGTGAREVRFFVDWASVEPASRASFTVDPGTGAINDNNVARGVLNAIRDIKAGGARVTVVVTNSPGWANGGKGVHYPPSDPADYASFASELALAAVRQGTPIDKLEVWNEPDGSEFWLPSPEPQRYADLLKTAYPAIKAASPATAVYAGPTTGNDYAWVGQLYQNGAKGSFDGVAVHTDTACLVDSPAAFYRQDGRLGQFTFLGYREVRATMLANGDDKPIAMSEVGWSSTGGAAGSCKRGASAGKKADGVTPAQQAEFLTKAYACMANDPYVQTADWFTFADTTGQPLDELDHYGLVTAGGQRKPAFAAFAAVAAADGGPPGACGDFGGPRITVTSPTPNQQFSGKLDLEASATDAGSGLGRITFAYDGRSTVIRNFTDSLVSGKAVGLSPWQGSGALALGAHTIEVSAVDRNGNRSEVDVPVRKVAEGSMASTLKPTFKLAGKVRCARRVCTLRGALSRGKAGRPSIGGKVAVAWELRNKKGRYRRLSGGLKPASRPFTFRASLKRQGRWRVRVTYKGVAPWRSATSKYLPFRLR